MAETAPAERASTTSLAQPLPIIIDTDPGIDDAMAIFFAMAEPAIDLIGLTTVFGNVSVEKATRNALQLVEMAGAEIPVARGAAQPLKRSPPPHPDFVHGAEGFGAAAPPPPRHAPDPRDAAQFLIDETAKRPGEITIAAIGPFTNLAIALERAPEIARNVGQVVLMGGAVRQHGNVTEHAEANVWQDPDAAARVMAANWRVTLIGLDVTETIRCAPDDLAPMTAASPICGAFLAQAADVYFDFHKRSQGFHGCFLHDPAALVAAVEGEAFHTVSAPLAVETAGDAIGRTREAPIGSAPEVAIALSADIDRVRARWLSALASGHLP